MNMFPCSVYESKHMYVMPWAWRFIPYLICVQISRIDEVDFFGPLSCRILFWLDKNVKKVKMIPPKGGSIHKKALLFKCSVNQRNNDFRSLSSGLWVVQYLRPLRRLLYVWFDAVGLLYRATCIFTDPAQIYVWLSNLKPTHYFCIYAIVMGG
jgi:hypothetical protein